MEIKKIELIPSTQEKAMLRIYEYLYYKNQIRPNGNIYWRCIHYNTENSCPASVTTTGVNTEIVSFSRKDHSLHPLVDEIDVKVRDMKKFIEKLNTIVYSSLSPWPLHNEIDDFLDVIGSLYQFKDEKSPENSRQTENEVKNGYKKARKTISSDAVAQNLIVSFLQENKKKISSVFESFVPINNFNINLKQEDINRLKPKIWLNDKLIDYFLNLLAKHSYKKIFVFNTFFYFKLHRDGPNSVKTWVKENIFLYELAFLPININSNHWILCAIESQKCKVTIYDSYLEE
ncbi:unnamed protein product [Brachionus calyciflorus]|uniref:Ubiquitin-like protease family profile domain-containing protein n=1 Tax=Brachionus calyciflorus TaxID=104777 RepID=A0A813MHL0_9BILA|nr:unnamed protein product [Brachionus calyciflorus]